MTPVEEGLAGPGALDQAAPVTEHRLEDAQTGLRVGRTPEETTRPITVASIPASSEPMRWMVEASA
jgi:hypothetical protein